MSDVLTILTANLPKPRKIQIDQRSTITFVTLDFGSIAAVRSWSEHLGIPVQDTDPTCRYISVRQEAGSGVIGSVRVHLIGTQMVPSTQYGRRQALHNAARAVTA